MVLRLPQATTVDRCASSPALRSPLGRPRRLSRPRRPGHASCRPPSSAWPIASRTMRRNRGARFVVADESRLRNRTRRRRPRSGTPTEVWLDREHPARLDACDRGAAFCIPRQGLPRSDPGRSSSRIRSPAGSRSRSALQPCSRSRSRCSGLWIALVSEAARRARRAVSTSRRRACRRAFCERQLRARAAPLLGFASSPEATPRLACSRD